MFKKSNNLKKWAVRQENSTFKHLQEDWPGPSKTEGRTQTPPPTLSLPSPQHTVSPCPPTSQWPSSCNTFFFYPGVPILGPNAPPTIWVTRAIRFLSHGDWMKATVLPQSCGNLEHIIPIQIYLLTVLNKNYRRPLFGLSSSINQTKNQNRVVHAKVHITKLKHDCLSAC